MELVATKNGGLLNPIWADLLTDRFFGNRWPFAESVFSAPPANVIDNENHFRIEMAVPGFSKDDFDIDIDDNILSVSAEKEEETKEEEGRYTRQEFVYSSFSRSFALPKNCEESGIKAEYSQGILTLEIPKKENSSRQQKKVIKVK